MAEPASRERVLDREERVDHRAVVGERQASLLRELTESGALLDRQVVGGDVVEAGVDEARRFFGGDGRRLSSDAVDKIAGHARDAPCDRIADRAEPSRGVVKPAEESEPIVVERLHSDRDAVDADVDQRARAIAIERGRVALHGDLDLVLRDGDRRADRGEHAAERARRPERRRTSTEEHAREARVGATEALDPPPELGDHGVGVALVIDVLRRRLVTDEIAIGAFLEAMRKVDVGEKGQHGTGTLGRYDAHAPVASLPVRDPGVTLKRP